MARAVVIFFAALAIAVVAGYNAARFDHPALGSMPLPLRAVADKIVHHHTLFPPHLSSHNMGNPNMAHWSFGLSSVVTDDLVRLTANKQSREGYLWNDVPVQLKSWTAYLGFRVHSTHALGGDALALWIVERPQTGGGPVVGTRSAGFRGVGIIFDSFDNDQQRDNPSVAILSKVDSPATETEFDPQTDYADSRVASCSFDFRNSPKGDVVNAKIMYDGAAKTLSVQLESTRQSEHCATIDVDIPSGFYFGMTAHTGQVADNHDVHWFVVTSDDATRGGSEMPGVNDIEGVDGRIRQAEHRPYNHQQERDEKDRWRAQS